jgi:sRNA-binding regulator protein Hfq
VTSGKGIDSSPKYLIILLNINYVMIVYKTAIYTVTKVRSVA